MGDLVKSVEKIAWEICDRTNPLPRQDVQRFDFDKAMFECEFIDMRIFMREAATFILIQDRPGSGYLIGLLGCTRVEWRDDFLGGPGSFTRVEVGPVRFSVGAEGSAGIGMEFPSGGESMIAADFSTLVIGELDGFRDDAPPDYTMETGTLIRSESLNWGNEVEVLRAWSMSRGSEGACAAAGGAGGLEVTMRRSGSTWPRRYVIRVSESDGTVLISKTSANPIKVMSRYLGQAEVELLQQEADALWSRRSTDYAHLFFTGLQSLK